MRARHTRAIDHQGPGPRRYLVQLTRRPLDNERREMLRAAGRLPADWRTRSVTAWDYIYVHANSDEEAVAGALANARIQVDRGEVIEAAEFLRDGSTRELPSALPNRGSSLNGE